MAKRRRTEIAFIADPAARLVTFSKRRKGLFNKASELCRLCDARAAVVVFSRAGKPYSFGYPSADDIISHYLRVCDGDGDGDVDMKLPMDLNQWEKWSEADLNACATEQELQRFITKYEALHDSARQKIGALEEEKSNVSSGGDSHGPFTEKEIDEIFNSLERWPGLPDLLADVDDSFNGKSLDEIQYCVPRAEEKSHVGSGGDSHASFTEEEIDELFNSLEGWPGLPDLLADVDDSFIGKGLG